MKIQSCEFPDHLLYDLENGTWADPREEVVRIGVTNLLSWSSGAFFAVTFKGEGTTLRRGEVAGSVEGPRHFDVVRSPISGVVVATNAKLANTPKLLNKDPYGSGWFMELRPTNKNEISLLKKLPGAEEEFARRMAELHVRCFAEFPDYEMIEIGSDCSVVLVRLSELLAKNPTGTVVHLVSDDGTAPIELARWSEETGNTMVETRKEGNLFHFIMKKK